MWRAFPIWFPIPLGPLYLYLYYPHCAVLDFPHLVRNSKSSVVTVQYWFAEIGGIEMRNTK